MMSFWGKPLYGQAYWRAHCLSSRFLVRVILSLLIKEAWFVLDDFCYASGPIKWVLFWSPILLHCISVFSALLVGRLIKELSFYWGQAIMLMSRLLGWKVKANAFL